MYLKANAKINLTLNVTGKRKDGYHTLDMIVLPIALTDVIATNRLFSKKKNDTVRIDDKDVIFPNDVCRKVIKLMKEKYNIQKRYEFSIYKKIPMQAGLGGASTDAVAIFNFYRKKFKLNITNEEAKEILLSVGSDMPFFLINKPSRVRGIGEIVEPIKVKKDYYVLIVKPEAGLSTKDVYEALDDIKIPTYNIDNVVKALETGDDDLLASSIGNVLEKPAIKLLPKIQEIKDYLIRNGLSITLMTGAGSAVFALSTIKDKVEDVCSALKKLNYNAFYTTIIKGE